MSKCHADNEKLLSKLLFDEVEDLDSKVPCDIANKANFKAFFDEDPIQKSVNKHWTKKIQSHRKYNFIPVSLSKGNYIVRIHDFKI